MATYVPLQSLTLSSNTTTVTFNNIDQTYTDLRLVMRPASSSGTNGIRVRVGNGTADSGSNYSYTAMDGNGSTAGAYRESGVANATLGYRMAIQTEFTQKYTVDFMNYSNTTTFKTVLFRYNDASVASGAGVFTWRSTSAINTISFNINTFGSSTGDFIAGSTFDLYGVSPTNATITSASGGTAIYYDSTYAYHVFTGTDTFTPTRALTADVLVVAGGGGGGDSPSAGGGGAGGVLAFASQSLSSGTSYAVTVGAGGAGGTSDGAQGASGGNSQFASLTAAVGGGGGSGYSEALVGGSGGGGGYWNGTNNGIGYPGAAGTSGQGNAGGQGYAQSGNHSAGGGGGKGGVGGNATNGGPGGTGGAGTNSVTNWGSLSAITSAAGIGVNGYIAGGGGGSNYYTGGTGGSGGGGNGGISIPSSVNGTAGVSRSGSGGGGGSYSLGGNGGSGIVIVRYER